MADVTQTFTPVSGTDGRVKVHAGSPVIIAGISAWQRMSKANIFPIPHFESPANSDGLVQPKKLRGLGDSQVRLEGIVNINATDQTETGTTALTNGKSVALDLIVTRTGTAKGYSNVVGWVSDFQLGTKINNEAATFSCVVDVDGVFPDYGTVT